MSQENVTISIDRPIILDEIANFNANDLELSTLVGMKDILYDLANKVWVKERCIKFFELMKSNNISFLDIDNSILTLMKCRVKSEDLHYYADKMGIDRESESYLGYQFLASSLDQTDLSILLETEVIPRTTSDVDFYHFVEQ